jgi:hypothetical protein
VETYNQIPGDGRPAPAVTHPTPERNRIPSHGKGVRQVYYCPEKWCPRRLSGVFALGYDSGTGVARRSPMASGGKDDYRLECAVVILRLHSVGANLTARMQRLLIFLATTRSACTVPSHRREFVYIGDSTLPGVVATLAGDGTVSAAKKWNHGCTRIIVMNTAAKCPGQG